MTHQPTVILAYPGLREALTNSRDVLNVARTVGNAAGAIDDAAGALIDATDAQTVEACFRAIKRAAGELLVAIAEYQETLPTPTDRTGGLA